MSYLGEATVPIQDYLMNQLGDTDVWYLTLRLPTGARFEYSLSPNDPIDWNGPRAAQRGATRQADPLNPKRWLFEPGQTIYEYSSLAELPGATPQPWIDKNPATRAGALRTRQFKSAVSGAERILWVYTPPDYHADIGAANDLVVVLEGGFYLQFVSPQTTLDNLIAAGMIPPTVVVFVVSAGREELPVNATFADSLATELVPWIRSQYHVTEAASKTVVAGASFGGLGATYAAFRHPDVFGSVLCQSGSFWWAPDHTGGPDTDATRETGWLAKQFIGSPKLPLKFYMDAGTFEVDTQGIGGWPLETSRHMRDVLLAKGYDVHYQQFVGAHSPVNWRGTFADGLLALLVR
jgi:enterochelin esterase family protein